MNIKEKIGKRIKELRTEAGFTQMELAGRASLDRTYINSVENGKRNISITNIEKIANALNINISALFESI